MGAHHLSDPGGAGPPPVAVAAVPGASATPPRNIGAPCLPMPARAAVTAAFRCAGEFL